MVWYRSHTLCLLVNLGSYRPVRAEVVQLLVFCHVARLGSFTKAAAELSLTQPAVSAQVARLEHRLRTRLVDRIGRSFYLTEAGRVLYSYAQQVDQLCSLLDEAEQAVSELDSELSAKLSIGASTTISIYMLPQLLAEFRRLHPKVEFALAVDTSKGILAELVNNMFDFALLEGPADAPGVEFEHFMWDELYLIVARGHPWALRAEEGVDIQELSQEPFISHRRNSGVQTAIQRELTRHGVEIVPSMVIDNIEVVKKSVEVGLGVSILSKLVLQREIQGGTLAVVPIRGASFRRELRIATLRGKHLSRTVLAFLAFFKEAAAAMYPAAPADPSRSRGQAEKVAPSPLGLMPGGIQRRARELL